MNQKQIFTEYWKILDDYEDYVTDGFSRNRGEIPQFKLKMKVSVPKDPSACKACFLHEHNDLRASAPGDGRRKLLIINRPLPKVLAEQQIQFSPEEMVFLSKWLEAIGLDPEKDCAVLSRVYCPVKDPRKVEREALDTCLPYFERTLKEVEPEAVLQLGLEEEASLAGRTGSIPLFRTYHPSDVLIDEQLKRPVWEVLKQVKGVLVGS